MEILSLITEQENAAAQLKSEAADKAREMLSESERNTDAEIKKQAAELREKRVKLVAEARKKAEAEAEAIVKKSALADKALIENAGQLVVSAAAFVAKEVGRL